MPKLPGIFNGSKCADLRTIHLYNYQQKYYQDRHEWDLIIKVGTYGENDTTSVRVKLQNGLIRKDTWKRIHHKVTSKMKWRIKSEYIV